MASYFIHPNDLKSKSYVDENVDDKLIIPSIEVAQDLFILPHIGTGLYDELQTQIAAGTLTALNTTLLNKIAPALRFWTLYVMATPSSYKFTNKAIVKKDSENSSVLEFKELVSLKDEIKNVAESYTERLKKYLLQNQTDYPLFMNPGSGVDTIHPTRESAFACGWYLGGGTKKVPDWLKAEYPGTYGTE